MKKRFLILIFTITAMLMCIFGLSACGNKPPILESISVAGETEVYVDEFRYSDYTITAKYNDNSTKTATLTADNLSADDKAKLTTVGTHSLTVNYESVTCPWTVTLKNHDFTGVTFEDITTTYDGTAKTLAVAGLPAGAEVSYDKETTYTNAGIYEVKATVTLANYNPVELTATLTIEKRELTLAFSGETTLVYNGNVQKTISAQATNVVGNDSVELTVTYSGEMKEAGDYIATVTLTEHRNYKLTQNNMVKVKITRATHKITFRQSGFADVVREVLDLADLTDIPTPQNENGYTVTWNRTEFKTVTQDILVEAVKTPIEYNIKYVLNGGVNSKNNPAKYTVESDDITLESPTKQFGSTFAGWYTTKSFTDESKITVIEKGSYGDVTLYAKWFDYRVENAEGFTIDYTQDTPKISKTVSYATTEVDLKERITVSEGCTWQIAGDKYGTIVYTRKIIPLETGNNVFYLSVFHPNGNNDAVYELHVYRLDMKTYAFVNGVTQETIKSEKIEENSLVNAAVAYPDNAGYTFVGWTVDGQEITFPYTVLTDTVFVAEYTPIEYTVIFRGNGGTVKNPVRKYTIETGMTFEIPTRDYYDFAGWYESETNEGAYGSISVGAFGDYEFYAKWTPTVYTITYELNGGSWTADNENPTSYHVETPTFSLQNTVRKAGYTFAGWFTDAAFENQAAPIELGSNGNKKFYAKWVENLNTLKFDGNGATSGEMSDMKIHTDETKTLTENGFIRKGYVFAGWSVTENGEKVYNDKASYTMGTNAEYTIYVVWQANENMLKFNGNGATDGKMSDMKIHTDETTTLTANGFTRKGYVFAGWALTEKGEKVYNDKASYTMGTNAEYTLYALWVEASEGLSYSLSNDKYSITGYTGTDTIVVIPAVYNGYPVTSIGSYAFENCISLTSITIPDSVTSIGDYAFSGCSSLQYNIKENIKYLGNANNSYLVVMGLTVTTLTSCVIDNNAKIICSAAFKNCSSLTSVTIGNSVTNIGEWAFSGCSSLTSVTIPNSVTSIGWSAFSGCSSLTSVTIPDSVTSIATYAFAGCDSLTSVTIPDSVTSIGSWAFEDAAYYNDANNWENGVLYIGKHLIKARDTLSGAYTIKDDTLSIANSAFVNCVSLTSVNIPDSVTRIGDEAFSGCDSLTSVTIPDSVTRIGDKAFFWCDSLTSVTIGNSVTNIGDSAFNRCSSLTSITVDENNQTYKSIDGNLYTKDGTNLITYAIGKRATTFSIPGNVTRIGSYAFYNCSNLTSITIPDSVTSIGSYAFYNCSNLTNVNIPDSVTSIGSMAFYNCSSLTIVTIPDSVTSIGAGAFENCSNLTSVTIGNSVTSIGFSAFENCKSLTSVTIPDSVTSIGRDAFYNCSSLTNITFSDTSTWYLTKNYTDWQNKSDGTETSVTDSSQNATYFKSTYVGCYWYKK